MTGVDHLRIDVREFEIDDGLVTSYMYVWVLQSTLPVTDEFRSCRTFATRAAAVADFEEARALMRRLADEEEF